MNRIIVFGAQKAPATIFRYSDLITDVHMYVTLPPIVVPGNGDWNKYEDNIAYSNERRLGLIPYRVRILPEGSLLGEYKLSSSPSCTPHFFWCCIL